MKFEVQLKDPDSFYDAVTDAVKKSLAANEGLDDEEREAVEEKRREKVNEAIGKWVEYGEYVTIEFDVDAGTATVVPLK